MARLTTSAPARALGTNDFRVLVGLFTVSGAAGLVDQVCFSKYLTYVVGATAHAVSAVLAAFMTGLMVGATVGGRISVKVRRPLVAYGVAEILVGMTVALAPLAFAGLTPVYAGLAHRFGGSLAFLSLVRWLVAFLVVAVPTAAMGATLPLVSAAFASTDDLDARTARERRLAVLYAANTFGGAAGALVAAYALLPAVGLSTSLYAAAAVSAFAGVVAVLWDRAAQVTGSAGLRAQDSGLELPDSDQATSHSSSVWLTVVAFLSGLLVFAMEVVATHLLVVIIGNSAYAFALILAAFLLSLFVGAALSRLLLRRAGDQALAYSLAASAFAIALTLPIWDDLGPVFEGLGQSITTFAGREAMRALVAFGILVVPATCMGFTFPIVLQSAAAPHDVGRLVGRLTAVNTAGAVVGALGTGYVVLPALGSERTLLFVAIVFSAAAAFTALRMTGTIQGGPLAASGLSLAVAFFAPRWDLAQLTAGTNVYFGSRGLNERLLHLEEDVQGGITTVALANGVRTLYTNGKFQGNDGIENTAQRYFVHYPCLFVRSFDTALIIGVGTGTTLGTLAAYPWKRIDVVDISSSVVEAARKHFAHTNDRALEDPRVRLTIADGRNHLQVTGEHYSLITMELSSVWFAGAGALYGTEYYRLIRAHLTEGGVFQQWVQLHHVERTVFARLVNTLRREFEHVALFYGGGQGILVASERPLKWSYSRSDRMQSSPGFSAVLPTGRPLTVLTDDVLAVGDGLDRFIADSAREAGIGLDRFVSNDDNLYLEYQTPRGNVLPWQTRSALVAALKAYRDPGAVAAMKDSDPD